MFLERPSSSVKRMERFYQRKGKGKNLSCFLISSGSSIPEKPPAEAIKQNKDLINQENRLLLSFSDFTSQLDNVPIINPSTPTTTTPIVNPYTTPPAPVYTDPTTTPTTTPTTATPATSTGAWCIASPTASETALQVALDYACGFGGADCSAIQASGSCYNPSTVRDHASYAFNDYYQKNPVPTSCVFGGTAQLSYTDPSKMHFRTLHYWLCPGFHSLLRTFFLF